MKLDSSILPAPTCADCGAPIYSLPTDNRLPRCVSCEKARLLGFREQYREIIAHVEELSEFFAWEDQICAMVRYRDGRQG